jgi:hypothetical protein
MAAKKSPGRPQRKAKSKKPVPSPQEVAPGVFLGGWNDAIKFEGTRFCVLDEAPDDMPAGTHLPVYIEAGDRPDLDHLNQLAREVRRAHDGGSKVLIYCGHGIRRGPLGAAWYLHRYEDLSLDAAYDRIRSVRPRVEHAREWIGHPESLEG